MYDYRLIREFWGKTKPNDQSEAQRYFEALQIVLGHTKEERFQQPFEQKKKSGGTRVIIPASGELKVVHMYLSDWIKRTIRMYDYSLLGGSLKAVAAHKLFTGGVCIDLSSAFNQITESHIRTRFKGILKPNQLELFIDLVTLYGVLQQGCGTSLFVFNAVMGPVDLELQDLKKRFPSIVKVTRYVDDICISVNNSNRFQLDLIADRAVHILEKRGFHGKRRPFYRPPIIYLGLRLMPESRALNNDKFDEIVEKVVKATQSKAPENQRRVVMGCLNWVLRVYGQNVPDDVVQMFMRYFEKAGPVPEKLLAIRMAERVL